MSKKILIRVVGAPLLLAALGGIVYLDSLTQSHLPVSLLLLMVACLSLFEFRGLCVVKGIRIAWVSGVLFLCPLLLSYWLTASLASPDRFGTVYLWLTVFPPFFYCVYVCLKLVFRHGIFSVEAGAFSVMGYLYVGLLVFALGGRGALIPHYLLFLVAANKGSDIAAYVVGKSMGRHKMTPVLSPSKTWEGCVGGAIGGTAAATAVLVATPLKQDYPNVPAAALLLLAFLVTMAAQVGDLVESAFKRWAGVKDSGRLLPEFGGMLDMVDSFLISVPVAHLASFALLEGFKGG